jgi:hypothetical protein
MRAVPAWGILSFPAMFQQESEMIRAGAAAVFPAVTVRDVRIRTKFDPQFPLLVRVES